MKTCLTYLTLADKILILVLLLVSLGSFPLVRMMTTPGNQAQIETDGSVYEIVSLRQERTISVPGPLGNTSVHVRDGAVFVTDSPCLNKICVKTGHISRSGELIACVPNKVVVRVIGSAAAAYDAETQ